MSLADDVMLSPPKAPIIVMTSGVFDHLHQGHLNLLWRTKQLGDVLVVGVVADWSYKKPEVVEQEPSARLAAIRRIPWVDVAVRQETTDPSALLGRFRPDVFTHGSDWDRLIEGHETLRRLGIDYITLPYTEGISSTKLRMANV